MKKCLILLLLILTLALPGALAQDAALYTPGSVTENLFADAFERGDMLALDMQFSLTLSENAGEIFGEDMDVLVPLCEVLENATFTVGAGKIDNGVRIMLAGDYTADAASAALDAALDMTHDGIVFTSSVIPGECVSAKWETLLSLAGMSGEDIASIMSLRDTDFNALLSEMLTQLQPIIDMAAQIAAPYGETIMAHIASLPMVVSEDVPAADGYPAAATEVQIQITEKAVGDLIIALCEQLKQDATLCALIDMMLAEAETADAPAPTTAQLCDAIMQAASEELTDETLPLNLFIGSDAAGNPLYLSLVAEQEDGSYFTIVWIGGQLDETQAAIYNLDVLTLTAEQEIIDGFSFIYAYDGDDANPNVMSAEMLFAAYADGAEAATFSFYTDNAEADYEGYSGYVGLLTMALHALDGETAVSMDMDAELSSILTAEDSEEVVVVGSMNLAADGEEIPMTFEGGFLTEVIDGAPIAFMTESAQLPELGIAEWAETYTLYAAPQESAQLTETALEAASPEALEALATRALESLEATTATLLELLPQQLLETTENAGA